jgi:hypothetical protein
MGACPVSPCHAMLNAMSCVWCVCCEEVVEGGGGEQKKYICRSTAWSTPQHNSAIHTHTGLRCMCTCMLYPTSRQGLRIARSGTVYLSPYTPIPEVAQHTLSLSQQCSQNSNKHEQHNSISNNPRVSPRSSFAHPRTRGWRATVCKSTGRRRPCARTRTLSVRWSRFGSRRSPQWSSGTQSGTATDQASWPGLMEGRGLGGETTHKAGKQCTPWRAAWTAPRCTTQPCKRGCAFLVERAWGAVLVEVMVAHEGTHEGRGVALPHAEREIHFCHRHLLANVCK